MKRGNESSIGDAIQAYLQSIGMKEKALVQRVIGDWERIMGKAIAENTDRTWYDEGIFWIKVPNPAWKQELSMAKSKIRETLNKELGAELIREVRVV